MNSVGSVVALKPAGISKSRLGALPVPLRRRLARTMALDTLAALAAATDRLVVVGGDPELSERLRRAGIPAQLVGEPEPAGMNAALATGDRLLHEQGFARVLAAVGDLPALTAPVIDDLLARTAALSLCFVADHTGYGTTLLIAEAGRLDPRFQGPSAQAHRMSGAVPVPAVDPRLSSDVDSVEDLDAVIGLGVGAHTATLITGDRLGRYVSATVAGPGSDDAGGAGTLTVITDSGVRMPLADDALDPQLEFLRPGQRVHAVTDGRRVVSAWL